MSKYELTTVRNRNGLYRVVAVNHPTVAKGTRGGWVSGSDNLSQDGSCWIYGDAQVTGNARVYGNARVSGEARVSGDAQVYGNAGVSGDAWVYGDARVYGYDAYISDNAQVSGRARVSGGAQVTGDARVYGNARVYGYAWVAGNAQVSGYAQVTGNAQVTDNAQVFEARHLLSFGPVSSEDLHGALFRTIWGQGQVVIGCWKGSVEEFRAMIQGENWPSADDEERELLRPEMLALADFLDARIATW